MHVSAMLSSLPAPFEEAVRRIAGLGFRYVDVIALTDRPGAHREVLAETDLIVSCAAIGKGLPEGDTLDAVSVEKRRAALEAMQRQITDAATLGATVCYIVPGITGQEGEMDKALERFTEAVCLLADHAAGRMVSLCVEHIPGRDLPTVSSTLEWLDQVGHNNLSLLLDIGHCLISGEDPAEAVHQAGKRLGYVHLDDNDSVQDCHWPLLTGKLTEDVFRAFLTSLRQEHYQGVLALELNPQIPDVAESLKRGRELVERYAEP